MFFEWLGRAISLVGNLFVIGVTYAAADYRIARSNKPRRTLRRALIVALTVGFYSTFVNPFVAPFVVEDWEPPEIPWNATDALLGALWLATLIAVGIGIAVWRRRAAFADPNHETPERRAVRESIAKSEQEFVRWRQKEQQQQQESAYVSLPQDDDDDWDDDDGPEEEKQLKRLREHATRSGWSDGRRIGAEMEFKLSKLYWTESAFQRLLARWDEREEP
jgi:hypothetical protein